MIPKSLAPGLDPGCEAIFGKIMRKNKDREKTLGPRVPRGENLESHQATQAPCATFLQLELQSMRSAVMCDYSLHAVASRPARVGERLVSTTFPHTTTRGFASADDPNTAVCLLPGTELAFDNNVEFRGIFFRRRRTNCNLARLRVANMDQIHLHHDTLELADGRTLLVTDLLPGQHVTVLQLPVAPTDKAQHEHAARTEETRVRSRSFASFF